MNLLKDRRGVKPIRYGNTLAYTNINFLLGRSGLYCAILGKSSVKGLQTEMDRALDDFRAAGQQEFIVCGLLTQAWQRFLEGDTAGADTILGEAWEIAERGSMRLHVADVHLHRARLFRNKAELKKARALIALCGYWRRKEELEDAEQAAKNWS
jgi:hypothetical protein